VDGDSGEPTRDCVTADVTFTIGAAKRGLLFGHAANHVGALALVPVEPLHFPLGGDFELIAPQSLDGCKAPRPFDFHKGLAGKVALIAGSELYPGAGALAALGALRGGAGLVTLHAPRSALPAIAAQCPPEVIIRGYAHPNELHAISGDALVLGCGLGTPDPETEQVLLDLLVKSQVPTVVDADGLNLVARSGSLGSLRANHVLTPHPGEFARLAPDLAGLPREQGATAFASRTPAVLLLKGGRTIVTQAKRPLWCNSTGTPGMATGGQGDLLAGVIGALLASACAALDAAALGAWLCGRAAEIALAGGKGTHQAIESEESLTASDVARHLGRAFLDWKTGQR
jgi:NAD(P)H-hydrate epimerase